MFVSFRIKRSMIIAVMLALSVILLALIGRGGSIAAASVQTADKVAYLTFDDGPSSITADILDVLSEFDVKATFFVTAQKLEYLDMISRAHNEGHCVAIHTFSHDYGKIYSSVDSFFDDIELTQKMLVEYTGKGSSEIRFAGGSSNTVGERYAGFKIMPKLVEECDRRGLRYHDWNVDTRDAVNAPLSVSSILDNVKKSIADKDTAVILMHDITSASTGPDAVRAVVEYLKNEGYRFDTVDNLTNPVHHSVK